MQHVRAAPSHTQGQQHTAHTTHIIHTAHTAHTAHACTDSSIPHVRHTRYHTVMLFFSQETCVLFFRAAWGDVNSKMTTSRPEAENFSRPRPSQRCSKGHQSRVTIPIEMISAVSTVLELTSVAYYYTYDIRCR